MEGYPFDPFGTKHLLYLAGTALITAAVLRAGRRNPDPRFRRRVVLVLIIFTLGQELLDDLFRVIDGIWVAQDDLPLQLCSLAMFAGVYALAKKGQWAFEVAYYWSLTAASQALFTPDPIPWTRELHLFWSFLSHGTVILVLLWLVVVEGMRCRPASWWRVFLITNLTLVPIAVIDLAIDANYFFIREKPGGSSPFLVGEWPWYFVVFEVLGLVFFFLVYFPMWWVGRRARV